MISGSYKPITHILSKHIFLFALIACCAQRGFAFSDSTVTEKSKIDYYIDQEQVRIDLLDGKQDDRLKLEDSTMQALTTVVYFDLIDSMQRLIQKPLFSTKRKIAFRESVYSELVKINLNNANQVKRFSNLFHFQLGEINAIAQNKLYTYLTNNVTQSLNTISVFRSESCADSFLIFAAYYRPDLVFSKYPVYAAQSYSQRVLEEGSKIAPVTVKRYFNPQDPIYTALTRSSDTLIKILLEIKDRYSRRSNAFTLVDDIASHRLTIEEANIVGDNPNRYLRAMLRIRAKKNPYGTNSLENELEVYSLKFIRTINDLHNEKDETRFSCVKDFSPEELYTLIVYSEEEIFTSTFNGLFNRLMLKLNGRSGFDFLNGVGENRFRTFIKMAAGFGKLQSFLQSMTSLHQQMLMVKFASGLEAYNDLSQATEVADAFASISDSLTLKVLRSTIKYQYLRFNTSLSERGTLIYGLLSNLFVERNISNPNWFSSVSKQYSIHNSGRIPNSTMFDNDRVNRWLIYFYDDEDGDASFESFLKTFSDKNWNIIDSGLYVIIKSQTGKRVHIYANKPKNEYEGQERLEHLFTDSNYTSNIMVHRGHSYYAYKTIEKIKDDVQVFILGSCGGYHSIASILDRSPDIGIVSSKQIGTRFVNNPMLKSMAECIRKGEDLDWQKIWLELDVSLRTDLKAYERFLDYIPPHKNLGAIFIKVYSKLLEQ